MMIRAALRAVTEAGAPPREEDADLVQQIQAGDARALTTFYNRFQNDVRTLARRLLGDAALAEDVVQEVFEVLPGALKRYRNDGSLRAFLGGITVRRVRRHVRQAVRRRKLLACPANLDAIHPPPGTNPVEEAERRQLAAHLLRALDTLPATQRICFVLAEIEGMTSREVATAVGVSAGTVRSRVFHARQKLQAALGELRK